MRSRETGSAVPSRVSLLILYTQGEYGIDIPPYIPASAIVSVPIRVYQVPQVRTDGVHRQASAGARLVVLKVA